jgi:glutamate racemase
VDKRLYILFIDSGLGGLSILSHFLTLKNDVNIIYYADTHNFPYGKKSESALGEILLNIHANLSKIYNISHIVIACNTASVSALKILRANISTPIIGTVPAIKPASALTKNNKIGIIATDTTVKSGYIDDLIKKFASDKEVFVKACPKLAEASESVFSSSIRDILEEELLDLKEKGIDILVLGCTHYSFLYNEIFEYFDGKIRVIDSREGVAKRILQLLPDNYTSGSPDRILYLSKNSGGIREKYEFLNSKYKIFNKTILEELSCIKA